LTDTLTLVAEQGGEQPSRRLKALLEVPPVDLGEWDERLQEIEREAVALAGRAAANDGGSAMNGGEAAAWADRLVAEVRTWQAELSAVAPWIGAVRLFNGQAETHAPEGEKSHSWATIRAELLNPTSLATAAGRIEGLIAALSALQHPSSSAAANAIDSLITAVRTSKAAERLDRLRSLASRAETLAGSMDFRPLYRTDRNLFAIGFNLAHGKLDNAC